MTAAGIELPALARWQALELEASKLKPEVPDAYGFAAASLANSELLKHRREYVEAHAEVLAAGGDPDRLRQALGFFAMGDSGNASGQLKQAASDLHSKT